MIRLEQFSFAYAMACVVLATRFVCDTSHRRLRHGQPPQFYRRALGFATGMAIRGLALAQGSDYLTVGRVAFRDPFNKLVP